MIPQIYATVMFVQDLTKCTAFYRDTLGFQVLDSDDDSTSFRLGDQQYHLLALPAAADLLKAEVEASVSGGKPRGLFAVRVENIDATYEALLAKGVTFIIPPTDQTWGLRSAHFVDPEGNIWEIHQPIRRQ